MSTNKGTPNFSEVTVGTLCRIDGAVPGYHSAESIDATE